MRNVARIVLRGLGMVIAAIALIALIPSLLGSILVVLLVFVVVDLLRRSYRGHVRTLNSSIRAVCDQEGAIENVAVAMSRSGPLRGQCYEFARRLLAGDDPISAAVASRVPLQLSTAIALSTALPGDEARQNENDAERLAVATPEAYLESIDAMGVPVYGQFLYLVVTATVTCLVMLFTGTFIVPTFKQMFEEFGLSLPMTWVYDAVPAVWLLVAVGLIALALVPLINRGRLLGMRLPRWVPLTSLMAEKRAEMLVGLAEGIEAGWPMGRTMALGHQIAQTGMERNELERAMRLVEQGIDPIESIRRIGWLTAEEASWLHGATPGRAAELLRNFAAQSVRDARENSRWIMAFLFPTVVIAMGIVVLLYAVAFFGALTRLTHGLT